MTVKNFVVDTIIIIIIIIALIIYQGRIAPGASTTSIRVL